METTVTKPALSKAALLARNVTLFSLSMAIACTSAVGTLWMTGNLDEVATEACQTIGMEKKQAQANQVVMMPVAFNAIPMVLPPNGAQLARWTSGPQHMEAVLFTNAE